MAAKIMVLAGVNGCGKSSIAGNDLREEGADYFNPDECTRSLMAKDPSLSLEAANSRAWQEGYEGLQVAIAKNKSFSFETTLGGKKIFNSLVEADEAGLSVEMWYCGLKSPELHIQRVAARVAAGGHDIPEKRIRERYVDSHKNLAALLPHLTKLKLYDNSISVETGQPPVPTLLATMERASDKTITIKANPHLAPEEVPTWAHPILVAMNDVAQSSKAA